MTTAPAETREYERETGNEALWHTIFAEGHPDLKKQHWMHRLLPRDPRCRMCLAPFEGVGGWWLGRRGKARSSRNPHYCSACDGFLETFPGGAEVEMSLLFVDIRNSTEYAQGHEAAEVQRRVTGFLNRATETITQNDGFIMAFYGDCVVAVWPPGFAGEDHADKALAAAKALIAPGAMPGGDSPVEVGVGLHKGKVYIGTVEAAKGLFRDVSIFGSEVILCARLAGAAKPGHALASTATAAKGASESVTLKGFEAPVEVIDLAA